MREAISEYLEEGEERHGHRVEVREGARPEEFGPVGGDKHAALAPGPGPPAATLCRVGLAGHNERGRRQRPARVPALGRVRVKDGTLPPHTFPHAAAGDAEGRVEMGTLTRASSEQLDAYERKGEPDGSGDRLMREAIRRNQMHSDALRPMSAKMSQPVRSKMSAMSTFGNERAMDSEMCLSSLNLEKSIKARKEARAPKMRWLKVITSVLFSGLKRANSKQMRSSMYLGHHAIKGGHR